jgi:hypothetical protein
VINVVPRPHADAASPGRTPRPSTLLSTC